MSDVPADVDTPSKPERCVVEHCYYAFDTLYCALTKEDPIDGEHFEEYLQGEFALHDHRFRPIEEKELRKLECCVSLLTDFEDAESYLDWEVGTHGIYITLTLPILPAQSTDHSSAPSPMSSSTFLARSKPIGRQRKLTATYLPDVIPAQGWTKQEAVDSALRKSGFDGRITEEVRRAVKLRRYQSSVASVRWDKFWEWRQRVTSRNEHLQFYLVVKAPSKPAGGPGPTLPLYLLNFLVYLQVAVEAIYVPSYTPAYGGVAPRPPTKLRLPQPPGASSLNIPTQSSPLRNSVQNLSRPAPLQPPETPNPLPMMSDGERVLGRMDMGVAIQSYFWGEENDGQRKVGVQDGKPSFRLLWLPEEDSWAMVYRLEVTVEYLRVRMQDPVLCLTASATLRDKPMSATPQRQELIELFKGAGGIYDVVKSKVNGNVPPKDEDANVDDVVYELEEVNLLEGLTEGITFTPEDPGDKLSLSTSRMGTGVRRQAFSLAPTSNCLEPQSPAGAGTTTATPLSTRPLPTLRKAFRKTLPTASGIQVRLLPSFVPHAFTDNDHADHDEDAGEEHSVVLSIELENSAGHNSGFLVEKVQVSVNGEDTQTRLLGSTNFPLALRSHDQYNLLYAVMFMLPPDLLDHALGMYPLNRRDSYSPTARDSFMHRIVTIVVTGRPFDLSRQDISSGGTQDLGVRTEPFDSRWHCPLDLVAMAQQNVPRSTRAPSTVSPSASVGPNRDVYPVPPSPFPSVMSQKRNSGAPQSAGNPFVGPLSSSTPDGSSHSSVFGGAPELPSATVAGSKRHTIAGLASLAAKRASLPQAVSQRASTPMIPSLSLNSPRFVPTPPSIAVAASVNLTPPATSGSIHSQSTPKGSPTMGGVGLAPSLSGPTGHTPVTPAFPAYPDAPLPSSPLFQAPMQGLAAAFAPPLDALPSRGSLSEPPIRGLRQTQRPPPVLQPVLVSVSLLSPESGLDERIYPMDTFSLEVFVFNESDVVRRCEISCPAKKRWRQEAAERSIEGTWHLDRSVSRSKARF
ncbi:hypothetical protein FRC10_010509 [Ceratobasidium sp. 414]|nr:hypothetical protein FRC10_010509 [Ceratobasidium sp. 414]